MYFEVVASHIEEIVLNPINKVIVQIYIQTELGDWEALQVQYQELWEIQVEVREIVNKLNHVKKCPV